jgi:hypothetical protein
VEFLEKFKSRIDSGFFGEKKIGDLQAFTLSDLIYQFTERTSQNLTVIATPLIELIVSLMIYKNEKILQNLGKAIRLLVEKNRKIRIGFPFGKLFVELQKTRRKT